MSKKLTILKIKNETNALIFRNKAILHKGIWKIIPKGLEYNKSNNSLTYLKETIAPYSTGTLEVNSINPMSSMN